MPTTSILTGAFSWGFPEELRFEGEHGDSTTQSARSPPSLILFMGSTGITHASTVRPNSYSFQLSGIMPAKSAPSLERGEFVDPLDGEYIDSR